MNEYNMTACAADHRRLGGSLSSPADFVGGTNVSCAPYATVKASTLGINAAGVFPENPIAAQKLLLYFNDPQLYDLVTQVRH